MQCEAAPHSPIPSNCAESPQPPRLLDQLHQAALHIGHAAPAADSFVAWVRRFILYHGKRHPRELELAEIGRFLAHVVATRGLG
jgi:hypothetical protein